MRPNRGWLPLILVSALAACGGGHDGSGDPDARGQDSGADLAETGGEDPSDSGDLTGTDLAEGDPDVPRDAPDTGDGLADAARDDGDADAPQTDLVPDDPLPAPPVPDWLAAFYAELRASSAEFGYEAGEWTEDYGDAPFYGTAFHVRAGQAYDDGALRTRAEEARAYDRSVVDHANADFGWAGENLEEVMMSALGVLEYGAATEDFSDADAVAQLLDRVNALMLAFGDYFDADMGEFATNTYGATAITGAVALINLQYALTVGADAGSEYIERAEEIIAEIRRRAWDGSRYVIEPGNELLELYPNAMMMLVLARASQVTGNRDYLDAARLVMPGIEPLRNAERGGFNSPYSAEYMGAETDDYTTLSSQNYLMLALTLIYEQTGDGRYLGEIFGLLDFVAHRIYDPEQRRILHHWMDGEIAQPGDPEYFCSGCNLQTLYILWYLDAELGLGIR